MLNQDSNEPRKTQAKSRASSAIRDSVKAFEC